MYAFFLVVTLLIAPDHPVKFYHTSHQRFSTHSECAAKGVETGDKLLAKLRHFKKKPNVNAHVSCSRTNLVDA